MLLLLSLLNGTLRLSLALLMEILAYDLIPSRWRPRA
jgi:hypothetical protein